MMSIRNFIIGAAVAASMLSSLEVGAITYRATVIQPADIEKLENAVSLVDAGNKAEALKEFESLIKIYPENYLINYEYCYVLFSDRQYAKVAKICKDLCKSEAADDLAYQLFGNALDMTDRPQEALKVLDEGLERFPSSGKLYLEKGTVYLRMEQYAEALQCYNKGIGVEPGFASNYFRAASVYFMSDVPIWGMVYAETEILINPSNVERYHEMSQGYAEIMAQNISIDYAKPYSTHISVNLTPNRAIRIDPETQNAYLDFAGVYEACIGRGVNQLASTHEEYSATIAQMSAIRRRAVEAYFDLTDNLYGNSMELLEYQKKIIDAGHWDAYNYFLFSPARPQEGAIWIEQHENELVKFSDWYYQNPLTLDATHSVGFDEVYRDYKPTDFKEAIYIQASLLKGKRITESEMKYIEKNIGE